VTDDGGGAGEEKRHWDCGQVQKGNSVSLRSHLQRHGIAGSLANQAALRTQCAQPHKPGPSSEHFPNTTYDVC
jgi:hypothetical protein